MSTSSSVVFPALSSPHLMPDDSVVVFWLLQNASELSLYFNGAIPCIIPVANGSSVTLCVALKCGSILVEVSPCTHQYNWQMTQTQYIWWHGQHKTRNLYLPDHTMVGTFATYQTTNDQLTPTISICPFVVWGSKRSFFPKPTDITTVFVLVSNIDIVHVPKTSISADFFFPVLLFSAARPKRWFPSFIGCHSIRSWTSFAQTA